MTATTVGTIVNIGPIGDTVRIEKRFYLTFPYFYDIVVKD